MVCLWGHAEAAILLR